MNGFYTFEGIDGSGKSSVMKKAARLLKERGVAVEVTREPTGTWLGKAVVRSYGEPVSRFTEALLFMADRATHCDRIRAWIDDGKIVLSDRFTLSTVAYQGDSLAKAFGGPEKAMDYLLSAHAPFALEPERVFLFDIDPRVGLERVTRRGRLTKFEKLEYLSRVRRNYLKLAEGAKNVTVIDASRPMDVVLAEVMKTFK